MCCDPLKPEPVANASPRPGRMKEMLHTRNWKPYKLTELAAQSKPSPDAESHEMQDGSEAPERMLNLNHYRIVNELWHFMSVDWGHKCTCDMSSVYGTIPDSVQIHLLATMPYSTPRLR